MKIDITKLTSNILDILEIENNIIIPKELLKNTLIDDLKDVIFTGELTINENYELNLTGKIKGIMILKDDLTLKPTEYSFLSEVEENLEKTQNMLDITDILWQNILVEIPSKVRSTDEDIELSGDGWRVISEDKFNEERNNANNPFQGLNELLNKKEEK